MQRLVAGSRGFGRKRGHRAGGTVPTSAGFTLVEVVIAMVVIAIMAAAAAPSYGRYLTRGKLSEVVAVLPELAAYMEKGYLDTRTYGANNACSAATPTAQYFTVSCTTDGDGQGYALTATSKAGVGLGSGAGDYVYTLDDDGTRRTLTYEGAELGADANSCWKLADNLHC